jgi:hypothetical protein
VLDAELNTDFRLQLIEESAVYESKIRLLTYIYLAKKTGASAKKTAGERQTRRNVIQNSALFIA